MKAYLMLTAKQIVLMRGTYPATMDIWTVYKRKMFGLFSNATGVLYVIEVNSLEEASENRSFGTAC
ncbi:hypothetical protein PR118_000547 [Bacillus atrophaeus]|nr:hypothetical protein [Bacillus atrophaeus]